MRKVVELCLSDGIGLIIPCKSGVIYRNITGGNTCVDSDIEGIYVPLLNSLSTVIKKHFDTEYHGNCYSGISEKTAKYIDENVNYLGEDCEILSVNREKLDKSIESWVYLKIDKEKLAAKNDDSLFLFHGFDTDWCVLTWENSD